MASNSTEPDPAAPALFSAQELVLAALATGATISAAARLADIDRPTVHRWLKNESRFSQAIDRAKAEYVLTLRDRLRDMSADSLDTLHRLVKGECHTMPHNATHSQVSDACGEPGPRL